MKYLTEKSIRCRDGGVYKRAERNRVHQKLKEAVKTGRKPKDRDKVPYMGV